MTEHSHQLSRYLSDGMIKQAVRTSRATDLPCSDDRMDRLMKMLEVAERSDRQDRR